jgi:hypothetical protein
MAELLKRPSALVPIVMSLVALATVVAYARTFGTAPQADEGTAAHVWQLLMLGQLPVVAVFVAKYLPDAPRQTLGVVALQTGAAMAAMLPIWWYQW